MSAMMRASCQRWEAGAACVHGEPRYRSAATRPTEIQTIEDIHPASCPIRVCICAHKHRFLCHCAQHAVSILLWARPWLPLTGEGWVRQICHFSKSCAHSSRVLCCCGRCRHFLRVFFYPPLVDFLRRIFPSSRESNVSETELESAIEIVLEQTTALALEPAGGVLQKLYEHKLECVSRQVGVLL